MTSYEIIPGPRDRLTDLPGLTVGNASDKRVRTGTTVILPEEPVVMAVDVRGGGPGTRDTDALAPSCMVDQFHALVLSGGSVFGLAAADGVAASLSDRGVGLAFGPRPVPVVPSAILYDLANGGDKDWGDCPPYRDLGIAALEATSVDFEMGAAGAGFGATAGAQPGGLYSASAQTENGLMVGALVAVNSFGSIIDPTVSDDSDRIDFPKVGLLAGNTTIAAVATNLALDKAGAQRLAIMAHDGLARAIRPLHTPFDGDTVFAISTGQWHDEGPATLTMALAGTMAADCLARAVRKGLAASA